MTYRHEKSIEPVIAVIDGMGGGIGAQIVTQLRQELPLEVEILALGANAIATQKMMQASSATHPHQGNGRLSACLFLTVRLFVNIGENRYIKTVIIKAA